MTIEKMKKELDVDRWNNIEEFANFFGIEVIKSLRSESDCQIPLSKTLDKFDIKEGSKEHERFHEKI